MSNNSTNNDNKSKVPLLYAIMGVLPSIGARELRKHYHSLSLQFHPDRHHSRDSKVISNNNNNNNDDSGSSASCSMSDRFHDITAAYHILSDPVKRAAYDTRHGVNFNSRVSNVHEQITRHNTITTARHVQLSSKKESSVEKQEEEEEEERESTLENMHEEQKCDEETKTTNTHDNIVHYDRDEEDDEEEEEEEEYMPEQNANSLPRRRECPFVLLPVSASSLSLTHSEHYSSETCKAFYSNDAYSTCNSSNNNNVINVDNKHDKSLNNNGHNNSNSYKGWNSYEAQSSAHQCLKTVTVTRRATASSWGLVFSRNNVLQSCSTHIGVPFPAVVLQINDYHLRATDDVCEVIERLTQQTENSKCNKEHKDELWYSKKPNNDSGESNCAINTHSKLEIYRDAGDDCCNDDDGVTKSILPLNANQEISELHMLITYNVEVYELRGDINALICGNTEADLESEKIAAENEEVTSADCVINYKLLEQLVPCNHIVSELPSLLPGHCVLRVNDINVSSALELRNALIRIAKEMCVNSRESNAHDECNESASRTDSITTMKTTYEQNAKMPQRFRSLSVKIEVASVNPCLVNKK